MAANQPTPGREVLPAGIDVRKIRKPINDAFASVPIELIGQGAATSTDGRRMSFTVLGEDAFYIRLNTKTTVNGTIRYGWTAVNQDRDSGNWTNCVRGGNSTTDDWATELNNTDLNVGTGTRYVARVNPQTGRVTFFFRNGGANAPPFNECNNGVCSIPPASVTITFPLIEEFPAYTYPSSFPNYNLNPGYKCYYNLPGDPRDGALRYESVNGWTYHTPSIYKKLYAIMSAPVTVPTSLGSWLETEIDIASDFADYFPMFGDYALYAGPTLAPDTTTPQKNYEGSFETNLITAKRFVDVRMTNGGSCTMRFEAKQRIVLTLETEFIETTYSFGPFGIPAGSTTQQYGGYWDGASLLSRRNPCGSDGDPDGADKFEYDGTTITEQEIEQSQGGTDGFAENVDCGETSVDYSDPS